MKMNERRLTRVSLIGIFITLVLLYIITNQNFSFHVKIGDIDKSFTGKTVNITGEITGLFTNNGHVFFDLKDETGKIKIVLWEDTIDILRNGKVNVDEIKNGKSVNIIGNVQLYKGELEVLPIHENVIIT